MNIVEDHIRNYYSMYATLLGLDPNNLDL